MPPSCCQQPLEAKIQMTAHSKINCFYSKMLSHTAFEWLRQKDCEIGASWDYMVRYKPN